MQINRRYGFGLGLFLLAFVLTACGGRQTPLPAQETVPGIGVEITSDGCPSIEAQTGMQITWTNNDTVDRILLIEHKNEQGKMTEAGGTDKLQPGNTFSIASLLPGEYIYYCSMDRTEFGTILITQ